MEVPIDGLAHRPEFSGAIYFDMLLNRICAFAVLLLLALPACQAGPETQEFEVEPGVRVITVHANTILEVPDDYGVVEEVQCYKIVHGYKLEIEFWLHQSGSTAE